MNSRRVKQFWTRTKSLNWRKTWIKNASMQFESVWCPKKRKKFLNTWTSSTSHRVFSSALRCAIGSRHRTWPKKSASLFKKKRRERSSWSNCPISPMPNLLIWRMGEEFRQNPRQSALAISLRTRSLDFFKVVKSPRPSQVMVLHKRELKQRRTTLLRK